jgi:hypothetical protein
VIENLFRPWLLGRVVLGATASVIAIVALVVAARALFREPASTRRAELALAEEKRIELVSTLFSLAGAFAWLDLLLAVSGADRLAGSIRGAMCAYGVLHASPWGFRGLGLAAFAALAASGWRALHAVDLTQREASLTRAKLGAAFFVAPLVVSSFAASTAFALDLDFRVVASCCSTGFGPSVESVSGRGGEPETGAMIAMLALGATAALLALGSLRAARRAWADALSVGAGLASFGAALAAVPAIVGYVAPHAYETPVHQCPFCLLRAEESGGVGWPLYGALALALSSALSLTIAALASRRTGDPAAAQPLRRRLARTAAASWLVALGAAVYPIARFAWVSGGASLFG